MLFILIFVLHYQNMGFWIWILTSKITNSRSNYAEKNMVFRTPGWSVGVLYLLRCGLFLVLTLRHVSPHLPTFISHPEAIRATLTTHNTMGHCRRRKTFKIP